MRTLYFNGIQADTGAYAVRPKPLRELAGLVAGLEPLKRRRQAREKNGPFVADFVKTTVEPNPEVETEGLSRNLSAIDLDDLAQAGWGILYPQSQKEMVLAQLAPLLAMRRQQAGPLYREIAYEPKQQPWDLLAQLGVPKFGFQQPQLPYYLLIVGQPDEIPFFVQYGLDRQLAVGRLALDQASEYANYARNVVRHEERTTTHLKSCFFGTQHLNEPSTALSSQFLIKDLARRTANSYDPVRYKISSRLGEEASKNTLQNLMGGSLTTDVLLTATHGVILPASARDRPLRQGAHICADWPGPANWRGRPIPERFIFAGKDVKPDASFNGMIAFLNTCYGGGTPEQSSFPLEPKLSRTRESAKPFVAHLPKRMMAVENGARAVIAHVDTTFVWSFSSREKQEQTQTYQSFFRELLDGRTVGYAMNVFQEAYLERLAEYQDLVEAQNKGELRWQDDKLVQAWFAVNDMRNHILLGDPAVRLPALSR